MPDQLDNIPSGQEPQAPGGQDAGGRDFEAEIKALRAEAAKYRTERNEARGRLEELSPLAEQYQKIQEQQKSEAEKLAERMAGLKSELEQQKAAAAQAAKTARLTKLAATAGVPANMLDYLDVNKFSDDDAEALEALKAIIPAPAASNGKTVNPARAAGTGEPDWLKNFVDPSKRPTIWDLANNQ